MRLGALMVEGVTSTPTATSADLEREIGGLTSDSRQVRPGHLFAALAGSRHDGAAFVPAALAAGAVAVLAGRDVRLALPAGVVRLEAAEPRRALALMAARFHGAQPAVTVAVTGTNGKTSVAEFTRQILARLGRRAASLGTIGAIEPDGAVYGALTTPDPVTLHETLAGLARRGVTHLAFEASSHGLDQYRLDGVRLTAGAFTNLGRDHLDYHPTVDAYLEAKLRLFRELLQPGQTAVVDTDGARAEDAMRAATARGLRLLGTGTRGATFRLATRRNDGFAQHLEVEYAGRMHDLRLPLIGAYQASNALVAAGLALAAGEDGEAALGALEHLTGVPGRLEMVGGARGGLAVVDYAHKPEALAAALAALRPFASGRLVCVVGCGGDRDKGKRPIMGRIAVTGADRVIVTDDNPRSEDPAAIRAEILAGAAGALEIGDRAEAIATAIRDIGPGDVVLVAGKGHESGQIVGDTTHPFSDREATLAALEAIRP
jgi:UDP-N-acetylmuramoyl-L-alanyl-D-glutamate--2,6-diaminopimelate ligase